MGYCYVLMSPDSMSISNNEIIRDQVFQYYGKEAGKRVQGFRLDPFEKTFHTSGIDEFIAVRDFSSHGQLFMFEE